MKILRSSRPGFEAEFQGLLAGLHRLPARVMRRAEKIFDQVARQGDSALFRWTRELEGHRLSARTVKVSAAEMNKAVAAVPGRELRVMKTAARRIRLFHRNQLAQGFCYRDGQGARIEERLLPLARVGLCIPGGRAPLASTVLMTAIPARLAGVREVVMITPWPGGAMNCHVLAAARVAGVDAVFKVGGAQGVAALACGTGSIPRVDKIVGPGSVWVTAAKAIAQVRGLCGIDAVAGPSEIAVIADCRAPAGMVAMDLLSQAEHGLDSRAILLTTSAGLAQEVGKEIERRSKELARSNPEAAGAARGVIALLVRSLDEAAGLVNRIAPEHLEIMTASPRKTLAKIQNAGSVFLGPYSPVPAGDYMTGANHVLPTGGTARWSSPLGVQDFIKRQSVTTLSRQSLLSLSGPAGRFARMEGLRAHDLSIQERFK